MKMHERLAVFAVVMWLLLALASVFVETWSNSIQLERLLAVPEWSIAGLLGYDDLGRSLLSRLVSGASVSAAVALWVTTISLLLGTIIGVISAWCGGVIDGFFTRLMDAFLAFPGILLAIALAGLLGPGLGNVIIALSVTSWVGFARLSRAQVLSLRSREHIIAAHALGTPAPVILRRHLLPLIMAPLLVEAGFTLAGAVIAEAGLSFLGLGVQAPAASWGGMLRDGVRYLLVAPHMTLVPATAMMVVVLSVNTLGDYLRDRLDIRLREGLSPGL